MPQDVSRLATAFALAASVSGACTRRTVEAPPPAPAADGTTKMAAARPTIFTDSALFALHCAQADSGLSPATGRCTPRDQRQLYPILRPPPR